MAMIKQWTFVSHANASNKAFRSFPLANAVIALRTLRAAMIRSLCDPPKYELR